MPGSNPPPLSPRFLGTSQQESLSFPGFLGLCLPLLILGSSPAMADQCLVLEREVGERVLEIVNEGDLVVELCEPCGETEPSWMRVRRIELVDWEPSANENRWVEVQLNGRAVDLAYTYLRISGIRWRNLAGMVACEATDVSPEIEHLVEAPDLSKEEPKPWALVLDITNVPFDGLRFSRDWTTREVVSLRSDLDPAADVVSSLPVGTRVQMVEVVSRVSPARVEVVFDRRPFHRGDIFYLLHALGDETYRVWYYGAIRDQEIDGIDRFDRHSEVLGCPGPFLGCWGVADAKPMEDIWARIVTETGDAGWVHHPTAWFDGVYSIPREHWPER